ncbi:MAG: PD-(D/E)XK nuclease family protein, partial [Acidobacteria bacterium]|nr:PD-(D/E)XK nuclease family protein [Acidobacteriota bacterium]
RLNRSVETFDRIMTDDLAPAADLDRGASRLLVQTRFLAAAFRGYERRLAASGSFDEHALRERLLDGPRNRFRQASVGQELGPDDTGPSRIGPIADPPASLAPDDVEWPFRHVIVTVGDRLCDPPGLWPADFDLLTRLSGVDRIDVIATEQVLRAGFQQRLEDLLPGLEPAVTDAAASSPTSVLVTSQTALHHVHRDREDELVVIAGHVSDRIRHGIPPDRIAIVVRRPLPYFYLARSVFEDAGLPLQTSEALPLAAEPFAAAVNVIFECVISRFTRASLVNLLRSPHFRFHDEEGELDREATATLNRSLAGAGYLGDLAHLKRLAEHSRAARFAHRITTELEPLASRATASALVEMLLSFIKAHDPAPSAFEGTGREARARAAVLQTIETLRRAYLQHDDPVMRFEDLAITIKRRIEQQTFGLPGDAGGVHLVDAQTAAYGEFDDVYLVGLVEGEWPERHRPSIFYPASLLYQLGLPRERERVHSIRAAFGDLLDLARQRVCVSTFTLDGDDIVEPSTLLEQLEHCRHAQDQAKEPVDLSAAGCGLQAPGMQFPEQSRRSPKPVARSQEKSGSRQDSEAASWLALRQSRTPHADPRFHGEAGPQNAKAYSVTSIDLYLDCPFKYFATHVLKLQEDPEDEESMSQKTRGKFVHEVFRTFFERWRQRGEGAITVDSIDRARSLFREVVGERLAALGPSEANLERTRLLGSPVAAGLGERVFRMEAERPAPIVDRLLEFRLDGEFEIAHGECTRRLRLAGTVDRLDLLADGSLRLIDYKLGRGPQAGRAIQLPIYALMAEQRLAGYRGRRWVPGEAGYLAFGRQEFGSIGETPTDLAEQISEGQHRLLSTIEAIERGSFPPQPAEPFFCSTCVYSSVCRKDYVEVEES